MDLWSNQIRQNKLNLEAFSSLASARKNALLASYVLGKARNHWFSPSTTRQIVGCTGPRLKTSPDPFIYIPQPNLWAVIKYKSFKACVLEKRLSVVAAAAVLLQLSTCFLRYIVPMLLLSNANTSQLCVQAANPLTLFSVCHRTNLLPDVQVGLQRCNYPQCGDLHWLFFAFIGSTFIQLPSSWHRVHQWCHNVNVQRRIRTRPQVQSSSQYQKSEEFVLETAFVQKDSCIRAAEIIANGPLSCHNSFLVP